MLSHQSWHQNTDCSLYSCHCPIQEELALNHHLWLSKVSLVLSGSAYTWPRPRHWASLVLTGMNKCHLVAGQLQPHSATGPGSPLWDPSDGTQGHPTDRHNCASKSSCLSGNQAYGLQISWQWRIRLGLYLVLQDEKNRHSFDPLIKDTAFPNN